MSAIIMHILLDTAWPVCLCVGHTVVCLSVCLSVSVCVLISVWSVCVCLSVCLCPCDMVCVSVSLSVSWSHCGLSVCLSVSVCVLMSAWSVCLSVCLSVCELVILMSPAKTTQPTDISFGACSHKKPCICIIRGQYNWTICARQQYRLSLPLL